VTHQNCLLCKRFPIIPSAERQERSTSGNGHGRGSEGGSRPRHRASAGGPWGGAGRSRQGVGRDTGEASACSREQPSFAEAACAPAVKGCRSCKTKLFVYALVFELTCVVLKMLSWKKRDGQQRS
jgi:hypothetical protein